MRYTLILLLLLTSCIGASVNNSLKDKQISKKNKLPDINVSDLEGRELNLPQDFKSRFNLVIFAFKHEQQKDVDPWLKALEPLEKLYPDLQVTEMPTIENSSAAFRTMVNNGMRSGIKDLKARQRTQTLYISKAPFLKALAISDESKVYPILFCKKGNILWRTSGNYSEEKLLDLKRFIEEDLANY